MGGEETLIPANNHSNDRTGKGTIGIHLSAHEINVDIYGERRSAFIYDKGTHLPIEGLSTLCFIFSLTSSSYFFLATLTVLPARSLDTKERLNITAQSNPIAEICP